MTMKSKDAISGKEGTVYINTADKRIEVGNLLRLDATMTKQKSEVRAVGKRSTGYKADGWSGAGTMSFHYNQSFLRSDMYDYVKTGIDHYYEVEVVNEDKSSIVGRQMVVLKDVNIDSIILTQVDSDDGVLEEDVPFTFEDFEIPAKFTDLHT